MTTLQDDENKGAGLYIVSPERLSQSTAALTEPKPGKDLQCAEEEDEETLCGIGVWTPKWLQRAADPKLFMLFYSLSGLVQGALFTYFVGCVSTMEKRFAYDTKKSGLIMIADELAPIMLGLFIGYFGGRAHRPRILTFGMIIGCISSFLMALPYFVYGPGRFDESFKRPMTRISGVNAQFCDKDFNNLKETCSVSIATPAVSMFVFGNFLKGVCTVIYYSIGTSYIDDMIKKKNSPTYLGEYNY